MVDRALITRQVTVPKIKKAMWLLDLDHLVINKGKTCKLVVFGAIARIGSKKVFEDELLKFLREQLGSREVMLVRGWYGDQQAAIAHFDNALSMAGGTYYEVGARGQSKLVS